MIRHHWFRRRVIVPVLELLKQGVTPERLAMSLAIGCVLGCAPILGVSTAVAFGICYVTGLNPVAMQLTNYVMYPVQIALLIPFIRAGEILFHSRQVLITAAQIEKVVHANVGFAINLFWTAIWHALVVWLIVAPVAVLILYSVFAVLLRHARERIHVRRARTAMPT